MIIRFGNLWTAGILALVLGSASASAADLRVASGPALMQVLYDLRPRIEGLTQRRPVVTAAAPGTLKRTQSDEPFDVVAVYEPAAVASLENNHLVDRMFCVGWVKQGQERTPIYAAMSHAAKEPIAAQRLIAFLSSFDGLIALTAHGLEGTPNE